MLSAAARAGKMLLVDAAGSEVWEPWGAKSALLVSVAKPRCYSRA